MGNNCCGHSTRGPDERLFKIEQDAIMANLASGRSHGIEGVGVGFMHKEPENTEHRFMSSRKNASPMSGHSKFPPAPARVNMIQKFERI